MAQQGPQQSFGSHTSEQDEKAELFSAVLSALNREQLPLLASTVLRRIDPDSPATQTTPSVGDPLYGSYHVLFPLIFNTGLRWAVKIPINGTVGKWNDLSASALASEASTMRMLKRETTIPLPDVLDFSSTTQNTLQCPYIMMTFISGTSLYDVWFGHHLNGVSPELTQTRRTRALENIAAAMIQLDRFAFPTGGRLVFGKDEKVSGIGPARRVDQRAMLDQCFARDDPDDGIIYVECAAYADPKRHYTFMLDMHPEQNQVPKGIETLLHQLISWIPEPGGAAPFVLAHPDFDIQNFIVSHDGELQAIIDWDGVAAMPRTLGNEGYPGWLTRDWDPVMYGYKESMDQGVEPEGAWEDSPTCLAYYRGLYDEMMARYRAERSHSSNTNLCRMSLITSNIAIAADDPSCRAGILRKMVGEIWAVAGQGAKLDFEDLVIMFAEGKVDATVMETLRKGFSILLSKEGL
ncbi:hypothetical protein GGS23DRAFT_160201 [Durotheca rogersii]|uniref:uncharacterized protein n=1 Tax=Durotheca rogersii TaxID=419775 RepID=UPI002220DACE|nr:uncharacterized protein GGS23DRAFT_160201 [Durotheca rogersii]KAI5861260.1 hypothetical protein GGS23DRAFT_160201 [Durotheca rogersii]